MSTIYVGGFGQDITDKDLLSLCITFGPINGVHIVQKESGAIGHEGYGFVEFEDKDDAKHALDNLNLTFYRGYVIKCNLSNVNKSQ